MAIPAQILSVNIACPAGKVAEFVATLKICRNGQAGYASRVTRTTTGWVKKQVV